MRRDQSTAQVAGHFRPGHFVGLRRLLDDGFDRGVNGLLRQQVEGRAFRVELRDCGRRRRAFPGLCIDLIHEAALSHRVRDDCPQVSDPAGNHRFLQTHILDRNLSSWDDGNCPPHVVKRDDIRHSIRAIANGDHASYTDECRSHRDERGETPVVLALDLVSEPLVPLLTGANIRCLGYSCFWH